MPISNHDQQFLQYLNEAKIRHPELIVLLSFHEQLSRAQFEFKTELDKDPVGAERGINFSRLTEGRPQITFEELPIRQEEFLRLSIRVAEIVTAHIPQYGKVEVVTAVEVLLKIARTMFESSNPIILSEPPPDITSLTAGLSLIPYLQRICEAILPHIPQDSWQRPYCPVCGGKPSFAAL